MWKNIKFRLMWYVIGLASGCLLAVAMGIYHNREIKRLETQNERYEAFYIDQTLNLKSEVKRLTKENSSLRSKTKIVEEVNADGSMKKTYENNTESRTETLIAEYETRVQTLQHHLERQTTEAQYRLSLLEKTRPSASFSLGIDSRLTPFISGTYNFYGPWVLQGFATEYGQLGVSIGVQF